MRGTPPLTDQFAKEGRDKKVTFSCRFTRAISGEAKWCFKQDLSLDKNNRTIKSSIIIVKCYHYFYPFVYYIN